MRWANDPEIRHLFRPFASKQQAQRPATLVNTATKLAAALEAGRLWYLIELDGVLVGEVNLVMDPPYLHDRQGKTAWFGVVIGEAQARGQGLGKAAMRHIEEVAREHGALWGQIGVFEFNAPARALYENLGYREIARIPEATWWKGKRWTDIRMQKSLQAR